MFLYSFSNELKRLPSECQQTGQQFVYYSVFTCVNPVLWVHIYLLLAERQQSTVMVITVCLNFVCSAKQLVRGEPNVSYICSRYYRAPELIFGATDYTSSIGRPTAAVNLST